MADIDYWLGRKYAQQQQTVNAHTTQAAAEANLTNTRAGLLPSSTAAEIALQRAQANQVNTTADLAPSLAASQIEGQHASALEAGARGGLIGVQTDLTGKALQPADPFAIYGTARRAGFSGSYGPTVGASSGVTTPARPLGASGLTPVPDIYGHDTGHVFTFAKGTAKVPGKGSGKKDTVKAKLAPGEAVLNKAAAEHVGRGLIAKLNQAGAQKMGMA